MNFDELVAHYGEVDSQIKALSKSLDADKATIKDYMATNDYESWESGGYKVIRRVKYRTKVDEDKMLQILKEDWSLRNGDAECPYIKTKEYVDSDALESALYRDRIPQETVAKLNACQTKTEEVALMCVKVKEK